MRTVSVCGTKLRRGAGVFAGLAVIFPLFFSGAPAFADPDSAVRLNCVIQSASEFDSRDPIVNIFVSFSDSNWSVVHVSDSGRQYDRQGQYYIQKATKVGDGFLWKGVGAGRPYLMMTGFARPDGEGAYVYEESLYDQRRGPARTYFMRSRCSPIDEPELEEKSPPRVSLRVSNADGEHVRHLNIDGLDITISPGK